MQNNRLGCFTGTGIFAAFITLFVLVGVAFASGGHMFSSGDLNGQPGALMGGVNSHAQISECKACHTALWERETMADRCLACHTDITGQKINVAELHGAITQKDPSLACRDCHLEHRGATASLTDMGNNVFPHEALGYSLNGHQLTVKREAFVCFDCHEEDITTFASDSCRACHNEMGIAFTQAHVLSFGTECLACHDGVDRYGDDFRHNTFTFQLIGEHAETSCTECHLDARTVADLQSASQDCFSCHQQDDEHAGKFGQDCAACHSSDGWEPANFNHDLVTFKLEGVHNEVACEDCHKNDVFVGTPQDCYSCHQQDDEHSGQFGADCATCHNPSDWDNASFDHNRTNFPLNGGHAGVECQQCHKNGSFTGVSTDCASCHGDPVFHAGVFETDCASCHNTFNWNQASFNGAHPEPSVDEGGSGITHGGAACRECHPSTVQEATCIACHEEGFEGGEGGDD